MEQLSIILHVLIILVCSIGTIICGVFGLMTAGLLGDVMISLQGEKEYATALRWLSIILLVLAGLMSIFITGFGLTFYLVVLFVYSGFALIAAGTALVCWILSRVNPSFRRS